MIKTKVDLKSRPPYPSILLGLLFLCLGTQIASAQFLLQAPTTSDEHNYRWYEASDPSTVLGTSSFYEATRPGIYFATYDGTLCGSNATGYFILADCTSPSNEVTLDISASVPSGATVSWSPALGGDQIRPLLLATQTVVQHTATVIKAGNSSTLPRFTVVCMSQAANLVDDLVVTQEDEAVVVPIFSNDLDLPNHGTLTTTAPAHGTVAIDDNGSANDPSDDSVTYMPALDYNGNDSFEYTLCNSFGDCSTATVSIEVVPVVDAVDDSVATLQEAPITLDVLANDNDLPSIGTFTVRSPSNGTVFVHTNGTADPSDDGLEYVPNTGYQGTDRFDYTLCDSQGNCSTATVTVIVNSHLIADSDGDGILDNFEDLNLDGDNDPSTDPTDTDVDGIPDYLDIDSDNDGIPDNVEAQTVWDYIAPSLVDANNNGLDDAYETNGNFGLIPVDSDGEGIPDYADTDSDNDNVPDAVEGHDKNHDGIADLWLLGSDKDNDGLDDGFEGERVIDVDVNGDMDDPSVDLPDTDSDGIPDFRDPDDDGDGIATRDEDFNQDGNYANDDSKGNGIPNYLDPDLGETSVEKIKVINVITPNGDGIHDVLAINGIENYPNNTLKIYNRWGVMVFQTKAYNSAGNVFDGTSQGRVTVDSDRKLPAGTYFYVLDYGDQNGNTEQLTGYIYLNR